MDEFGVRPLYPTPRGGVDLIWKDADGNRDGDVLRGEKGKLVFPIQTSRRDRRVRQPVEGDVVENVISRKALGLAGKDARHERLTGFVVVEYPGRQTDGRVRNPVKRLWAVPHLEGVAKALLIEKGEPIESVLLVLCETGWGRRTGKSRSVNVVGNRARHVGVNGEQFRRRQHAHQVGNKRTPIATLRHIVRVSQTLHQHSPCTRDAFGSP